MTLPIQPGHLVEIMNIVWISVVVLVLYFLKGIFKIGFVFRAYVIQNPIVVPHPQKLRNTYTTRMLFTVIPSEKYAAGGVTLQTLLAAVVEDMNHLYEYGVEV